MTDTVTAVRPVEARRAVEKKEKTFRRPDMEDEFEDILVQSKKRRKKKQGQDEAPALTVPHEDEALFQLMFQAENIRDDVNDASRAYAFAAKTTEKKIDIVR